jgi:hypothetical protein
MKKISACMSIAGGVVLILIAAWGSWKFNGLMNAVSGRGFEEANGNGGSFIGPLVFLSALVLGGFIIKLGFDDFRKETPTGVMKSVNIANVLLTLLFIIIFGGYFIWYIQTKEKARNTCMDKCKNPDAPADCSSSCYDLGK